MVGNMVWDERRITEYCQELIDTYFEGKEIFMLDVVISNRMRRTHGCVEFYDGVPIKMKISRYVLEHSTDEEIKDLIKHEFSHWYSWIVDGKRHGHDKLFKQICYHIGCESDGATNEIESLENVKTKWEIHCPHCGMVWRLHRKVKAIDCIEDCACTKCDNYNLYVVQNW